MSGICSQRQKCSIGYRSIMQDGLAVEIPKESECDDRHTFEVNCCIWFVLTLPTLPCLRLHSGCVQLSPVHWSTETYHMECRDVNATHLQQEIDQYFVLTYASRRSRAGQRQDNTRGDSLEQNSQTPVYSAFSSSGRGLHGGIGEISPCCRYATLNRRRSNGTGLEVC